MAPTRKQERLMQTAQRVYVIGDIHGQLQKLTKLLRDARLIDSSLAWSGGNATIWFMGDFVDRGPDGIAVIDLVMRLQQEAARAGGSICSILGNHEMLFWLPTALADARRAWAVISLPAGNKTGEIVRILPA
jgi:hypothetical protein